MSRVQYRAGAIILFAAALGGMAVAVFAYVTPLTGVTGTVGAMIAIAGTLTLALAALVLPVLRSRPWRNAWRVLILLGLVGTFAAGLLLHQWMIAVAMAIGLAGLLLDMTRPSRAAPVGTGRVSA